MYFSYKIEQKAFIEASCTKSIQKKKFFTTATLEGLYFVTFQTE